MSTLHGAGSKQKKIMNKNGTKEKTKPMMKKFRGKNCMTPKRLAIFRPNLTKD